MVKFAISSFVALVCVLGLIAAALAWLLLSTPRPENIRDCITTAMYEVHLCSKDANYVRLRDISKDARNAVIVSEDGAFYTHQGIDWFELRESFDRDWEKGEFARGGSTITQQLAKNVYLNKDKSLLRKVREAIIAIQLEGLLSKDEILEKYLNVVEFGEDLYGIERASRHYFQKSPAQLTPAEGAFLAFLLPSPKKYSVSYKHKQLTPFARKQMRSIVNRMFRFKKINEAQESAALAQIDNFFGLPTDEETPDVSPPGEAPNEGAPTEDAPSLEERDPEADSQ